MILAFEEDVLDISVLADADLSAYQYHFVKLSADNTVGVCTGASDIPLGVLQNKPSAAGQVARGRVMGVSRVYTGVGGITFANKIGTDASGHGVPKSANKAVFLGEAMETTASTVLCAVILHPQHTITA